MRTGFSCKEAAAILGIHERRVTQSVDPTLERIAKLWIADPDATLRMILEAVASQRSASGSCRLSASGCMRC